MSTRFLNRIANRALLMVLPDVETIMAGIPASLRQLDRGASRIEAYLADQAVRLANDAKLRREAIENLNKVMDRRDEQTLSIIRNTQAKLEKASSARDAVSDLIDRF